MNIRLLTIPVEDFLYGFALVGGECGVVGVFYPGENMKFDHVAVNVENIARSVQWYRETLQAVVLYEDETWAFLEAGGIKIALTLPRQHPSHIAFDIGPTPPDEFFQKARTHRDGSVSRYIVDPDGNAIEWIHYPSGPPGGAR